MVEWQEVGQLPTERCSVTGDKEPTLTGLC